MTKTLSWTHHAQAKMAFYKLSKARVLRVLHSPKRIEEGVAPKTVAMMQPVSLKTSASKSTPFMNSSRAWNIGTTQEEGWTQEIWVMMQDSRDSRTIISAWRYPGKTKPNSEVSLAKMREEYQSFIEEKPQNKPRKASKNVVE